MARRTTIEKVEDLASDLQPGAAVEDAHRLGDNFRALVWARNGREVIAYGYGSTKEAARAALLADVRALTSAKAAGYFRSAK